MIDDNGHALTGPEVAVGSLRQAVVLRGLLELPDDDFVALEAATDQHFALAAELAAKRLPRCKFGSVNWHWYHAVIAEHEARRRGRITVIIGGEA